MAIHFTFEGKHYELPDGTTPEQAKAKILAHLGRTPETAPATESVPTLAGDLAKNVGSAATFAADFLAAIPGMAAALPYGLAEGIMEGPKKGIEAFHEISGAMNPLSGEFQYSQLRDKVPGAATAVAAMDKARQRETYEMMGKPFEMIPQGYGNIAAAGATVVGAGGEVATKAGEVGELGTLLGTAAVAGASLAKPIAAKFTAKKNPSGAAPNKTPPALPSPEITLKTAAQQMLDAERVQLGRKQDALVRETQRLDKIPDTDPLKEAQRTRVSEIEQEVAIAERNIVKYREALGQPVEPTAVPPVVSTQQPAAIEAVAKPAGEVSPITSNIQTRGETLPVAEKPRIIGPKATLRESLDEVGSEVKRTVESLEQTTKDADTIVKDYRVLEEIDKYATPEMQGKPIPAELYDTVTENMVHADKLERYAPEKVQKWDTDFLSEQYERQVAKSKSYAVSAEMLNKAGETVRSMAHQRISNNIVIEAVAPMKKELYFRQKDMIEQISKTTDQAEVSRLQGLLDKIDSTLGVEDAARLKAVIAENVRLPTQIDPKMGEILRSGGHEATLDYISTSYKGGPWGFLADHIKSNPWLRPLLQLPEGMPKSLRLEMNKNMWGGLHNRLTGRVAIGDLGISSPEIYLHEVSHNATSHILDVVRTYRNVGILTPERAVAITATYKSLPVSVTRAASNLLTLRDQIRNQIFAKDKATYEKWKTELSSDHEFVAYGLTDPTFMNFLANMEVHPAYSKTMPKNSIILPHIKKIGNALRVVMDSILDVLGINRGSRTANALEQLWTNGLDLVDGTTGKHLNNVERVAAGLDSIGPKDVMELTAMSKMSKILQDRELTKKPSSNFNGVKAAIMAEPDSPRYVVSRNWFGNQQFVQTIKKHPLLYRIANAIRYADDLATEFKTVVLNGDQNIAQRGRLGPFVKLSKIEAGDSPIHLINKLPLSDWVPVMRLLQYAGDNRIPHSQALSMYGQALTASQRLLHTSLTKAYDRDLAFRNQQVLLPQTSGGNPLSVLTPRFDGWHHLVRKGDFDVFAEYQGANLYVQRVRTKAEAEALKQRMGADPNWKGATIDIVDRVAERAKEPTLDALRKDAIERAQYAERTGKVPQGWAKIVEQQVKDEIARGGRLGGHHLYRTGMPGYEGRKIYKTDLENAKEFRQGFIDYVDEIGSLIKKKTIQTYSDQFLNDFDIRSKRPNQVEVGEFLRDQALNTYQDFWPSVDKGLRDFVDTTAVKLTHLAGAKNWYPSVHVLDKTHGVFAHLFYIFSLTSRPGFWLAQALSGPQAIRQMFRTDNTMAAFAAMGKGIINLSTGGDLAFREGVHYVASKTNSFHPQFVNEINSLAMNASGRIGDTVMAKFLRNAIPWITGEKMAGAGDTISRYVAYSMLYEFHKSLGKTGEALYKAAAADVDTSMVMYNSPNKAPIIRKMGVAGEAIAPLQTFAQAQLGNLVADWKYMLDRKSLKSTAPFIATGLTTMMLGGAIGLPFIAEYELLRKLLIMFDDKYSSMPSVLDVLNRKETLEAVKLNGVTVLPENVFSYGLPSALTGFDVGSGLRWNPVISRSLSGEQNILSILPAVEFGRQFAVNAMTVGKHETGAGMVRDVEHRKAMMFFGGSFIGGKALVDETMFDAGGRRFVPGGTRGYATVEETDKERAATLMGNRTVTSAINAAARTALKEEEMRRSERRQRSIDTMLDGILSGDSEAVRTAVQALLEAKVPPDSINEQLKTAYRNRNIPERFRFYLNSKGQLKSEEQMRKYEEQRRFFQ